MTGRAGSGAAVVGPRALSFVIPFRARSAADPNLDRLDGLLPRFPDDGRAIVVDDSLDAGARERLCTIVARRGETARVLRSEATAADAFSIGRLRDAGAAAAEDGIVMFHDVDFFAPAPVYARLAETLRGPVGDALASGGFLCAPVAFLTRIGTLAARTAGLRGWGALAQPWTRRARIVDRLVRGSSAIILERRTLLEIGGHSSAYEGHGAEDFELMHRLSLRAPRGPRPANYPVDYGSRAETAEGFRAYFARYAEPLLEAGVHLGHLWHPPRRQDPRYYAAKRRNFERLRATLSAADALDDGADALRTSGPAPSDRDPRAAASPRNAR